MKARIKETGALVDVIPKCNFNALHSADNLYVCDNLVYRGCELDFLNVENLAINWEQRRYELAKAAMQGLLNATSVERFTLRIKPSTIAEASLEYADVLIGMLKGGQHELDE